MTHFRNVVALLISLVCPQKHLLPSSSIICIGTCTRGAGRSYISGPSVGSVAQTGGRMGRWEMATTLFALVPALRSASSAKRNQTKFFSLDVEYLTQLIRDVSRGTIHTGIALDKTLQVMFSPRDVTALRPSTSIFGTCPCTSRPSVRSNISYNASLFYTMLTWCLNRKQVGYCVAINFPGKEDNIRICLNNDWLTQ